MTSPPSLPPKPTYRLAVFALVRQQGNVLLVRPHHLLLPGGPQSLPGHIMLDTEPGLGVVETGLRRHLLSQVGIAVSDFRLVGSHISRSGRPEHPTLRMNLIFGTEYCSGILNPQPDMFKSALWVPQAQLVDNVPEWLRSALHELEQVTPPSVTPATEGSGLGLFRRRQT
ncbi:hypothetical protein [Deinococcus cavernae]|uniref:hypothetical protein n=1 Tax=Deinococcus cavernae TaxID=2320857 RepID=UPI001F243B97|nr:hypothetical protein [Deinococcus cavernae]